MLTNIRKLVYRMGFRPKFGTILFSPTLHIRYTWRENFDWTKVYVITEDTRLVRTVMNPCEVCGMTDDQKAMAFRTEKWCSENHRKIVKKDDSKRKTY